MLRLFVIHIFLVGWLSVAQAQTQEEAKKFAASISAPAETPRSSAYRNFTSLHVIARPHPEKDVEAFIQRANKGDRDAFAFIAMMVWQEYAGFRGSQLVGKLALNKALNDGSALAAYFIGETRVKTGLSNANDRSERYLDALHWFGVAAGMGETRAHDRGLELIKSIGLSLSEEQRRQLHILYNAGMEQGVSNRRKSSP
jgi:hypothetical protein